MSDRIAKKIYSYFPIPTENNNIIAWDDLNESVRKDMLLVADSLLLNQWQDISTAPKDGTNIQLWWPKECHCPITGHWETGKWSNCGIGWKFTGWGQTKETEPTHWRELPLPPSEQIKDKQ